MRKIVSFLLALMLLCGSATAQAEITVTVDLTGEEIAISPLIYGINNFADEAVYKQVTATAARQGGNRMSAYNWETNASNAGSDWHHYSDTYLSSSVVPGDVAMSATRMAGAYGIPYRLTTLQLAGYVSADTKGAVDEKDVAPSARFAKVEAAKNGPFTNQPDLTDGTVYMDEYVAYLVRQLGDASSETGIQAYALDNEPALWNHTHSRVHPEPVTAAELIEKSIATARAVKAVDPKAEIYGPALYGFTAYDALANDPGWQVQKIMNHYKWFIDYYLDQMRKAEKEYGVRLLDVLDIHYYSESARVSSEDRLQSVRTLYEDGFVENSWIGQWRQESLPLLPKLKASIDRYYPGTKLAITEYNYGGEDITATIAQAETLGCFAANGVYSAFIWGGNAWQYAGINLYTNYDGQGGAFGDALLPTLTPDHSKAVAYAALREDGALTVMVTNKTEAAAPLHIHLTQDDAVPYQTATVYAIQAAKPEIALLTTVNCAADGSALFELPAMCAAMVVFQ